MKGFPRSLRGRLLASAALLIGVALVATGLAVQVSLHRFVQGQIDQRLDGQLLTLSSALAVGPNGRIVLERNVDGPPFDDLRSGWVWMIRTPTHIWMSGGGGSADVRLPPVPPGPFAHPETLEGTASHNRKIRARVDHVVVSSQDATVIAAAPIEALNGPLRDALWPLFTTLVVLGGGLMLATLLQVRIGLRPLTRLRTDVADVRAGRSETIPTDQPAEVGPLVAELNSLLTQQAVNLERARRHVANLAHALKTPLASLLVAIHEPGRDPDGTLQSLASAMDRHVRHHLARARVAALGSASRSRVVLRPRVEDHLSAFRKIYADKPLSCDVSIPSDLAVACDLQDVDELLGNLLDNAFKWARSQVSVEASETDDQVVLIVEDDGPGLDPSSAALALGRGQRLDESVPGHGFGLSIVHEIVELYGGSLDLSEADAGGLRARLRLPRL